MDTSELKNLFQNKYSRENWIKLLRNIFPDSDFQRNPEKLTLNSDYVKECYELGSFETPDGSLIGIFEVYLDGSVQIERNRVGLRNILRPFYKQIDGAFAVFYQGSKWRFSFISEIRVKDEYGEWVDNKTEPKRYTYVLGKDETVKTAVQRFDVLLNSAKTLENINEAFSVEKLSKEFFDKYITHYKAFVNHLSISVFKENIFNNEEKHLRDFVKKLLGRIVFIYFLQKKGWMGVKSDSNKYQNGDPNFMYNLFIQSGKDERFYSKWLKKLFFNTLNNPNRDNELFKMPDKSFVKIPYLNGGLFEDDDPKGYIEFPPELFEKLFDFFNQYNFTIYEDSPEEQTVAVDPEMLGHIFENLLEDNKDKGAYYTPKEIVHYMCQESLIEYLMVKLNIVEQKLASTNGKTEDLFGNKKSEQMALSSKEIKNNITRKDLELLLVNKEINSSIIEFADEINKHVDDVKICDPAIGSGAFPMGLLNEIFIIKQLLQPLVHKSKKLSNAAIKENIIQNSIYGVDIEKGAVDIARLRFWLSLVVDEDQPRPLPNLDYKIVVGNSLLPMYDGKYLRIGYEYKGDDRNKAMLEVTEEQLREIENLENEFFKLKDNKDSVRQHISHTKIDLIINLLSLQKKIDERKNLVGLDIFGMSEKDKKKNEEIKAILDDYDIKIKSLKDAKRYSRDFNYFDWHLDFSQVFNHNLPAKLQGFDIVIGNPPYIRADNPTIAYLRKEILESKQYESLWEKWDIFVAFIEKGFKLLKENGILSMIVSDGYMTSKYSEKSHNYFLINATINRVNFLSDLKLFDAAVRNIIVEYKKYPNPDNNPKRIKHIEKFENMIILPTDSQKVLNDYTFKIETSNKAVGNFKDTITWGELCYVSVGLVLQSDELNHKGEFKKEDLISDVQDKIHIKPYIEAKWTQRYFVEKFKYLEWNTKRVPNKIRRPTFPELYTPKKIIRGRMTDAIFDDTGLLCNDSCFISVLWNDLKEVNNLSINNSIRKDFKVKGDKSELRKFRKNLESLSTKFNLKYLLAILNSKLGMHNLDAVRRSQIGFYPDDLKKLPIKVIPLKEQEEFANIVDKIIEDKKLNKDTSKLQSDIDNMIYKLYELTNQEIIIIENTK